jgi:uncharacterized protein YfdQ (DUF2303 family)
MSIYNGVMEGKIMNETVTTSTKDLLDAGKQIAKAAREVVEVDGQRFMVLPAQGGHMNVINLSEKTPKQYWERPKRKTGTVALHSIESFAAFVNRHKQPGTMVYITTHGGESLASGITFEAVLNDHEPGDDGADWGDFRAAYQLLLSPEWVRWMEHDRGALAQKSFCEHMENFEREILKPDGATLLKLLQDLEGRVDCSFKGAVNLHNGSVKVGYTEDVSLRAGGSTEAAGEMTLPDRIELKLPPFENAPPYKMWARLRVRVAERKLFFQYETQDAHLVIRDAVNALAEKVKAATGIEPLLGKF